MATASASSRLVMRGAAVAAAGIALMTDVGLTGYPTHSVVLGLVAVVVWALHQRLIRQTFASTTLPVVSAALAAQPVLHFASKVGRSPVDAHDHASFLHVVTTDAPSAVMQVVVPAVALLVLTSIAHLLCLLLNAMRSPAASSPAPSAPPVRPYRPIRVRRRGTMLHWCGWVIRAARRGPPLGAGYAIH